MFLILKEPSPLIKPMIQLLISNWVKVLFLNSTSLVIYNKRSDLYLLYSSNVLNSLILLTNPSFNNWYLINWFFVNKGLSSNIFVIKYNKPCLSFTAKRESGLLVYS